MGEEAYLRSTFHTQRLFRSDVLKTGKQTEMSDVAVNDHCLCFNSLNSKQFLDCVSLFFFVTAIESPAPLWKQADG